MEEATDKQLSVIETLDSIIYTEFLFVFLNAFVLQKCALLLARFTIPEKWKNVLFLIHFWKSLEKSEILDFGSFFVWKSLDFELSLTYENLLG